MRIVNYIHKVQGFDKAFPILLELKTHLHGLEIMTILDLEEKTKIDAAAFFTNLCLDISDHVAIYDGSQFSAEIAAAGAQSGKLRHDYPNWLAHQQRSRLRAGLSAARRVIKRIFSKGDPADPLGWAAKADVLLGIYNGFNRPLAQKLRRAVKSNGGRVVGYFKAINDEGHGISALENPSLRVTIPQKLIHGLDSIVLPSDDFRAFFSSDVQPNLIATGYPPFYTSWKNYVEGVVRKHCPKQAEELSVVILTRGEIAHKKHTDQIISEETLHRLLRRIHDILERQGKPFRMRVKPHPYQNTDALAGYIRDWPRAEMIFDPPVLLAADADIVVAIYSSAILDGLVFGASLIEYFEENEAFRRLHFKHSPFGAFGARIARSEEEFEAAVRDALRVRRYQRAHPKVEEANVLARRLPEVFTKQHFPATRLR
jgi:hypothetical protein